jgi:hypothetical protein
MKEREREIDGGEMGERIIRVREKEEQVRESESER